MKGQNDTEGRGNIRSQNKKVRNYEPYTIFMYRYCVALNIEYVKAMVEKDRVRLCCGMSQGQVKEFGFYKSWEASEA